MKDTKIPDSLRPGDLVGPWRVEGYAGRGSYGAVYRARRASQPHSKPVALKIALFPSDPRFGTDPEALKEQFQLPLPQRRPAHEFNRRVVPELSALIERMLAKEPEERGTAREIAEAAESAAEHASPEANVPPSVETPAMKPAPIRERRVHAGVWRPGAVAAASLLMAVVGTYWLNPGPQGGSPEGERDEAPVLDTARKAGTRGLGDSASTARFAAQESPVAPKAGAIVQFPDKPLPGQMRPPCRSPGQVEINGGCWQRFADVRPPCANGTHEWKGECYWPVPERPRVQPRTAKPPR